MEIPEHITPDWLAKRYAIDANGCWLWIRASYVHRGGYGAITANGKAWRAHRLSYEVLVGPIPEGLVLDHLCNTPQCINPEHLEPVTVAENTLRSAARITHCPQGHEYREGNIYWMPTPAGKPTRICLICRRGRDKQRYYANQRKKATA
jgi:hypothetical protein